METQGAYCRKPENGRPIVLDAPRTNESGREVCRRGHIQYDAVNSNLFLTSRQHVRPVNKEGDVAGHLLTLHFLLQKPYDPPCFKSPNSSLRERPGSLPHHFRDPLRLVAIY